MDPVSAFCWTMVDLDACIRSSYHYHQLRIAGLVRLLTFDGNPLATQVNRIHRLKLRFTHLPGVTDAYPDAGSAMDIDGVQVGLAPLAPGSRLANDQAPSDDDLSSWLRLGALRVGDRVLSVQEFAQQMAYVEGLTHAGQPRDDLERKLVAIRDKLRIIDVSEPSLLVLREIGRVTHTGLSPLFNLASRVRTREGRSYPRFLYEDDAST
jgi:hypothetical protein